MYKTNQFRHNNTNEMEVKMEANLKKVLATIVYYSIVAVMVAFVVFMMISLAPSSMAIWEKVCLYILTGALALVTIYDVICTCMHKEKYIAGFMLYIISMLVVILTLIIMALNSADGRLILDISERFFRLIIVLYLIDALGVCAYAMGEKLVNIDVTKSRPRISSGK